jgi:D-serine deaminase-like pyridoxal phosphate-dependent protein
VPLGRDLDALETPAAVVDLERMAANLRRAAAYVAEHRLAWRPHTKTHKSAEIGALQIAAGADGLTVATLREAEVMAAASDDLLLAYPPVGVTKIERALSLPNGVRLTVAIDSEEALLPLARRARDQGRSVGVLVEVDLGMRRVGVGEPAAAAALAARAASLAGVELAGLLFYPGHVRLPVAQQGSLLAALAARLGVFLDAFAAASVPVAVVSGGSTPTFWRSHEIPGLTEVRPGTNLFNDRTTALLGACGWEECAYSVLATVVSTAVAGQAVMDAGSKALAKEELPGARGYGALLERPEVVVGALSEEHGVLDLTASDWRPRVGDRVRVVPNHVCVSVNLQEELWGVRGGVVVEHWRVAARGRGRPEAD